MMGLARPVSQREVPRPVPADERAWELVRRWPRLRGEAKLAWQFAWRLSRGGREQIVVSPEQVGQDQGTSRDAGRRQLMALNMEGLLRIVDRGKRGESDYTGRWLIELGDPAVVARAKPTDWDGQQVLAFLLVDGAVETNGTTYGACDVRTSSEPAAAGGDSSEAGPSVWRPPDADRGYAQSGSAHPSRYPTSDTSVIPQVSKTSHFGASLAHPSESAHSGETEEPKGATGPRGSARGNAQGRHERGGEIQMIGDVLDRLPAALRGGMSPRDRQCWIEELAQHLHRRVNCPLLRMNPCVTAAQAAIEHPEGVKIAGELARILLKVDQAREAGRIRTSPSAMFNDLLKRARAKFCF